MPYAIDIRNRIEEYVKSLNQSIFNSLARKGIVSFNKIKNSLVHTCGFGSEETQDNVCVNFIELNKCKSEQEKDIAIKTALWEEYMGVFGIALERPWPLQFFQHEPGVSQERSKLLLVAEQIKLRLHNNIVFVLSPPDKRSRLDAPVKSSKVKLNLCYEHRRDFLGVTGDGYSQSRGGFLVDLPYSSSIATQVTEIKTTHEFAIKKEEIIAILVPTHLMDLASSAFEGKGIQILPVPMTANFISLKKIPEILQMLHGHAISDGLSCIVPDYESVLKQKIIPKHQNFSLHAVRLQTIFDIQLRYIENINLTMPSISTVGAEMVVKYQDNSAWIMVHSSKLFKLDQRLICSIRKQLPTYKSPDADVNVECRDALLGGKGTHSMMNYYDSLTDRQQEGLFGLGIKIVSMFGYHILSVSSQYKDIVTKNLARAVKMGQEILSEKQSDSACKIQAIYRGHRVRQLLPLYRTAQMEFQSAKDQLSIAKKRYIAVEENLETVRKRMLLS